MNTPSIGSIFHAPEVIAFAGDWHANALWGHKAIRYAYGNGASVILHTGDFGYDYRSSFIPALEEELAELGILILFVRGNHDDPEYLDALPENDQGFKPVSDHIWYIPQGTSWMWDGVKFLGLGGAHSVDRPRRTEGVSWWARETMSTNDMFKATINGRGTHVMLTHDCPAGVTIPNLRKGSWAPTELALAHRHRERMYEVVRAVKPNVLFHGHYHSRYTGFCDVGAGDPVKVVGLDCDDRTMAANMVFAELEHFKEGQFNALS